MPVVIAAPASTTPIKTAAPPRWMKATAQRWRAAGREYLTTPEARSASPEQDPRGLTLPA